MEDMSVVVNAIPTSITFDQDQELVKAFTQDKIHMPIKSMHPTKALGPNGMNALFYQ